MENIHDMMIDNNETWIFYDDNQSAILIPNKEYILEQ